MHKYEENQTYTDKEILTFSDSYFKPCPLISMLDNRNKSDTAELHTKAKIPAKYGSQYCRPTPLLRWVCLSTNFLAIFKNDPAHSWILMISLQVTIKVCYWIVRYLCPSMKQIRHTDKEILTFLDFYFKLRPLITMHEMAKKKRYSTTSQYG